jgi:hypothetical protein
LRARRYTLAEARAVLPQVKQWMGRVQVARSKIMRLRPEALPALRQAATNGGSHAAGELALHFRTVEEGVKAILALGILIKDLDSGLLDFLGMRAGHDVYLCWRHGEEDILFWHELDAGFAGRQPVDGLVD